MSLDKKIEELGYEIVMGLETHVQLNTKTKLFCSCDNEDNAMAYLIFVTGTRVMPVEKNLSCGEISNFSS